MIYQPRDFIETPEGLIFAVVDPQPEDGRVLCFLRYVREGETFRKLGTHEANVFLSERFPAYLFASGRLEARLHGVAPDAVSRHYRPRERVQGILAEQARDAISEKAARWLAIAMKRGLDLEQTGLTGSLLIGAQNPRSDLDFVIYGREAFFRARGIVQSAIESGALQELRDTDWREAYERRGCALGFEEYLWHERRKGNKGMIAGTKFDITLVGEDLALDPSPARKLGATVLRATVTGARDAFDFPARYRLDHPEVAEALCFTATYAGQAEAGETLEIAGIIEETQSGQRRIVVGSSREAPGEYVRVVGKR